MRGVTKCYGVDIVADRISTHTPHARRDMPSHKFIQNFRISTHTPHARRDYNDIPALLLHLYFNSHASCEA